MGEAKSGGEASPAGGKKLSGKTMVLFIALPALLILGGGGTAAMLLMAPKGEQHAAADDGGHGKAKPKPKKEEKGKSGGHGASGEGEAAHTVSEGDGVYFLTLPDMLVNVATADGRPAFLKLRLTLEAPTEDIIAQVEPELPRVMDQFQAFLRELRVDDLSGSAGAYRLRLELLRRVNIAVAPAEINAVLIEEMLIQ